MVPIHNGPGKWDLMLAFFDQLPAPADSPRRVTFWTEDGDDIEITIISIRHCSIPRTGFVFAGSTEMSNVPGFPANEYVTGIYDVHTRKGVLRTSHKLQEGIPTI